MELIRFPPGPSRPVLGLTQPTIPWLLEGFFLGGKTASA